MEGLELKGDFEQRRPGRNKSENKAACFECGRADHSKAQCPIWIKSKKMVTRRKNREMGEGKRKRKEEVGNVCVSRWRGNRPMK